MTLKQHLTDADYDQQTFAVRSGQSRSFEREHCEPIYTTSSYVFESAAQAAAVFAESEEGNVYSRYTNPTQHALEQRLAAMEGAEAAVAVSSGMAAILSVCMAFLKAGEHIVCSRSVFGTTTGLLNNYLTKFGISVDFVDLVDESSWQNAIRDETKILFVESPSNPLCEIADLGFLGRLAKETGARLVVDNTYCTPVIQRPLKFGADIVLYSGTKYLDGQGRCVGGVVLGSQADMADVLGFVRTAGPSISPFNAWVLLKGLETLNLRMRAHSENALALAQWLEVQPAIEHVYFTGLDSHPQKSLIDKQQQYAGGVLSFKVKGGRQAAWQFIDATQMLSLTANLGDAKSTIVHPASTTHGRLSDEQRLAAGITENLIRVSVGLEAIDDIITDIAKGVATL